MFTGIVEEVGSVARVEPTGLTVSGPKVTSDLKVSDSINVNGACLTVTALDGDHLSAWTWCPRPCAAPTSAR